jgi:hypothetical protein
MERPLDEAIVGHILSSRYLHKIMIYVQTLDLLRRTAREFMIRLTADIPRRV